MANNVATLALKFTGDTAGVDAAFDKVIGRAKSAGESIDRLLGGGGPRGSFTGTSGLGAAFDSLSTKAQNLSKTVRSANVDMQKLLGGGGANPHLRSLPFAGARGIGGMPLPTRLAPIMPQRVGWGGPSGEFFETIAKKKPRLSSDLGTIGAAGGPGFAALTAASALGNVIADVIGGAMGKVVDLAERFIGLLRDGVKYVLEMGMNFERAQTAFETMVGSTDKGRKLFSDIQKLAAETPFKAKDLIDVSKRLLGFGLEPEELIDTMRRLGDIAAGTGSNIDLIGLAYAQVLSKGKLTAEELTRQLGNVGVGAADIAQALGMSQSRLLELMEKGMVSADMFKKAIVSLTSAGGRFSNAMSRDLQTVGGRWDQLVETMQLAAGNLGASLFEKFPIAKGIESITNSIGTLDVGKVLGELERIGAVLQPAAEAAMKFGIGIGMAAKQFAGGLTGSLEEFSKGLTRLFDDALPRIAKFVVVVANLMAKIAELLGFIFKSSARLMRFSESWGNPTADILGFKSDDLVKMADDFKSAANRFSTAIDGIDVDSAMKDAGGVAQRLVAAMSGLGPGGVTPVSAEAEAARVAADRVKRENKAYMEAMESALPGFTTGVQKIMHDSLDPKSGMTNFASFMQDSAFLKGAMNKPDLFGGKDAINRSLLASYQKAIGGLAQNSDPIYNSIRARSQDAASAITHAMAQLKGIGEKGTVEDNIRRLRELAESEDSQKKEVMGALLTWLNSPTSGVGLGGR